MPISTCNVYNWAPKMKIIIEKNTHLDLELANWYGVMLLLFLRLWRLMAGWRMATALAKKSLRKESCFNSTGMKSTLHRVT